MANKKTRKKSVRKPCPVVDYVLPPGKALVLRTCKADMSSNAAEANGFKWPKSGPVKCDDWQPTRECGNGLHGLLWGEGSGNLLNWGNDAVWLVVEIDTASAIDLDGKIKFPEAIVVHCGNRETAPKFISEHGGAGRAIVSGTATAGVRGTATAGYSGTAKSGEIGIIVCRWWDEPKNRYRLAVGYVGEDGIKPNTFYRADTGGNLIEVTP